MAFIKIFYRYNAQAACMFTITTTDIHLDQARSRNWPKSNEPPPKHDLTHIIITTYRPVWIKSEKATTLWVQTTMRNDPLLEYQ